MSGYALGWLIMVLAVAGCLGSTWGLYRYNTRRAVLGYVLIALFVLLIVPAPVPAYPEFLAPAFAVAIFEWIFQDNGRPEVAFRILGIGLVAGVLLSVLAWFIQRLMRQRRQAS